MMSERWQIACINNDIQGEWIELMCHYVTKIRSFWVSSYCWKRYIEYKWWSILEYTTGEYKNDVLCTKMCNICITIFVEFVIDFDCYRWQGRTCHQLVTNLNKLIYIVTDDLTTPANLNSSGAPYKIVIILCCSESLAVFVTILFRFRRPSTAIVSDPR